MTRWARRAALGTGVVGMAAALFIVGAAVGAPGGVDDEAAPSASPSQAGDPLDVAIADLQGKVRDQPRNHRAWTELGLAYLDRAQSRAEPASYADAASAFEASLRVRPEGNDAALTGQATLAAAQHQFATALRVVDASLQVNDFNPTAYGVKVDALTELGRYDDAKTAAQRMLDLRPGLDAYARASYQLELRGDVAGARQAMERAIEGAPPGGDQAFGLYYLGELAWHNGDPGTARRYYDKALAADPTSPVALTGQAKTLAAADPTAALALYREAVALQPEPSYLLELAELLEATGQAAAAEVEYDATRDKLREFAAGGTDVDQETALLEADRGNPTAAMAAATAALRARPDSILVQDAYAWALHAAGRSAEALPYARKAQRLGTRLPFLRYHLGVIEAAVGQRVAAKQSLTAALALNPEFHPLQAPAARKLLATLR